MSGGGIAAIIVALIVLLVLVLLLLAYARYRQVRRRWQDGHRMSVAPVRPPPGSGRDIVNPLAAAGGGAVLQQATGPPALAAGGNSAMAAKLAGRELQAPSFAEWVRSSKVRAQFDAESRGVASGGGDGGTPGAAAPAVPSLADAVTGRKGSMFEDSLEMRHMDQRAGKLQNFQGTSTRMIFRPSQLTAAHGGDVSRQASTEAAAASTHPTAPGSAQSRVNPMLARK